MLEGCKDLNTVTLVWKKKSRINNNEKQNNTSVDEMHDGMDVGKYLALSIRAMKFLTS